MGPPEMDKTIKFCTFQSVKLLSTIYEINPLDDLALLHISMTQQMLSSKTILATCNSYPWDLRFSSIILCAFRATLMVLEKYPKLLINIHNYRPKVPHETSIFWIWLHT